MRSAYIVILAACAAAAATGAAGQTLDSIARCRSIEDDARRLSCYDSIALPSSQRSKYEMVPLEELQDYALSYRGRLVEVEAWLSLVDGRMRLSADAGDEKTIPVDIESLPRRMRDDLRERCADGCAAVVQGQVRPVSFTTGIVADAVIPR